MQANRLTEVGEDNLIDFKMSRRQVDQLKVEVEGKLSQEIQVKMTKVKFLKSIFFQSSQSKKEVT
jgi:hypothetical protein